MQMLTTKSLIHLLAVLFFILPCLAEASFKEYFQLDSQIDTKLADRITQYYNEDISLSLEQQKSELFKLQSELDKLQNTHDNQAIYWFIKGLLHRNIASYYSQIKNTQLTNSHIQEKNNAYKKALELGEKQKNKLSASIYSIMKHGLPEDLKIKATQEELTQGGNGENESYYWYLHWSNIDQLKNAGREDEAEKAYKKMHQEMKKSRINMSVYNDLNKQVETSTFKKPAGTAIKTKTKQAKPKTEKVPKKEDSPLEMKYIILFSVIIFSIFSLISVTAYEYFVHKKKI